MALVTSGKHFKEFYNDDSVWGSIGWFEGPDGTVTVDGKDSDHFDLYTISDSSVVKVRQGTLYHATDTHNSAPASLQTVLRKWLKNKQTETIVIEVSKDSYDKVVSAVKELGGRILP